MGSMWCLDSGASFHMTENIDFFSDLEEKDLKENIYFGDDGRYSATDINKVNFRAILAPLSDSQMFFFPGLKKNLVSILVLEKRGYNVLFSEGKVFLRHISTR